MLTGCSPSVRRQSYRKDGGHYLQLDERMDVATVICFCLSRRCIGMAARVGALFLVGLLGFLVASGSAAAAKGEQPSGAQQSPRAADRKASRVGLG